MPKPRHSYFDAIFEELSTLDNIVPRALFGHQGYAFGSSVFAFLDEDRLVVRSEKFLRGELPHGLSYFMPDHFQGKNVSGRWVGIQFDDSLGALRKHWPLIEESYRDAVRRDQLKTKKKRVT